MSKAPVVFLIFNRPDLTEIVFQQIRKYKPENLLVVADGARFSEEEEKCYESRNVIKKVDWDCKIQKNYTDYNMGCRKRVSSGLTWAFSHVEEAIILEDDCLPSNSFFFFCEHLLKHYRIDQRIMHISGNNFQHKVMNEYSYYFSKYNHIWGWATWRRAWNYYDVTMQTWKNLKKLEFLQNVCGNLEEQKYWLDIFEQVYQDRIDTWDYQWTYACWLQKGLSILPNYNLVTNIGFRSDATRTKNELSPFSNLPTYDIWDIKHPPFMIQHPEADSFTFDNNFGGLALRKSDTLEVKLKSFLSPYKKWLLNKFTH